MTQRIAIVGIGCRFPGGVNSPDAFWELLESGRDPIGPIPDGRFDVERFIHPEPGTPGKLVTADGGFLEAIDQFDAAFFGLSPREARKIDPQHRLLLEVAYEALEDAGIPVSSLAGRRVGVYAGIWTGEYENVMYRTPAELDFHSITGGGRYAASGRISYAFDLRGPAMTVDTGCSASLVALHLARQAIESGEADLAIVAAANLVLQPHVNIGYSRSGMLSVGGRCRFGDDDAAGYVRSDGAAAIVLKPLEAARSDRDPVRGVVLATGVNADGRGSGQLATPSSDAQAELLETVYARADIDPSTVPYVEAHGTGTRAGDPVELSALGRVLGNNRSTPLVVGSVKTNIGHTEACAGMAGLIKTLLALEHRRIPANLHLRTPNATIAWGDLHVEIPTVARDWPEGAPLVAGVSSFGITGTNAHVVVAAEDVAAKPANVRGQREEFQPYVLTVSGATTPARDEAAAKLRALLRAHPDIDLRDVAYTTTVRREHHMHRLAVVADSIDEAIASLEAHAAGEAAPSVSIGQASGEAALAFVFSGQGSQWVGMTRELFGRASVFTETLIRLDALVNGLAGWSIRDVLLDDSGERLERVDIIQPTLTCVQIALAEQLRAWGVIPRAVVGHSMGEVAAACVAGALSMEDAVRVIVTRSRLLARIAGNGAMALLDLDETETLERIANIRDRVSVAALNGPRSTVISGDPAAIDELLVTLDDEGVFCRRVKVDVASHSAQTDPLLDELASELSVLQPQVPTIPFHSTPRPGAPTDALLDAAYWVDNLRQAVRLNSAVQGMIADGINAFVEIAPHPVLLSSLADIAADADADVRTFAGPRRDEPELRRLYDLLARLHVIGAPVAWDTVAAEDARVIRLPAYPWQRERHWIEAWEDWSGEAGTSAASRAQLPTEAGEWLYELNWIEAPPQKHPGTPAPANWLVVADATMLREATVQVMHAAGQQTTIVDASASAEELKHAVRAAGGVAGIVLLPPCSARNESGVTNCVSSALALVQAVLEGEARPLRVIMVTHRALQVAGAGPSAEGIFQAPLWGFARVVRDEIPELDVRLLDLDAVDAITDCALRVLHVVVDPSAEADVAVRHGRRWVPRLERSTSPEPKPARTWPDGATLISGGLGDLGLAVAGELVERGVRWLVLLSRTPLPPRTEWRNFDRATAIGRRIAAVLALEARGAHVHCSSVDVGDDEQLHNFLMQYEAEAWPSINAVVHTAGVIDSHLVRSMSEDALETVFHGKARGAWLLHCAFPGVQRFVMFSSTSVLIPQAGEANYAAANAFLDALCALRRSAGQEAQVINWGVWRNSGVIANDAGARYVEEVKRQGIDSMDPAVAVQVLSCLAAADTPQLFVAPIDWQQLRQTRGATHLGPAFEAVIGGPEAASASNTLEELAALDPAARRNLLDERLRAIAARVLGTNAQRLRADATLGSQGLDSLMALELRNHIEGAFELKVSATVAWNYPTLTKLSAYLLTLLESKLALAGAGAAQPDAVPAPTEPSAAVQEVRAHARILELAGVSEEDVLRELRGGL